MRSLKHRPNKQTLVSTPRSGRLFIIRWIYLLSLLGAALFLANLFIGDWIFFRSEGLVMSERAIIAAEFPVTVHDIKVKEGEIVKKGQVVAIVSSQNVAETIARLNSDLATRATRQSELRIRGKAVEATLVLAKDRQKFTSRARKKLETLYGQGNRNVLQHSATIENEFRSYQDLRSLQSEKQVIASELATLKTVLTGLRDAIANLQKLYDDGRLRSPTDGIVFRTIANRGSVIRAGEPLAEIYGTKRYILAYVKPGGLSVVNVGDKVVLETGLETRRGVVKRIEPFASVLPQEFQRVFSPVDRQQVLRIELEPGESSPPLFTKVTVRSADPLPSWLRNIWGAQATPNP